MHEIVRDLLNNILFVAVPLLFYQHFLSKYKKNEFKFYGFIVLIVSTSILLCMSFPVYFSTGWIFDLRQIPLIIITLYGGFRLGLIPILLLLVYRFFIGGEGFLSAFVIHLVFFLTIASFSPIFNQLSRKLKPYIASGISLFTMIITLTVFSLQIGTGGQQLEYLWFSILIIQAITSWVVVHLIEDIHQNSQIKLEISNSEKAKLVSDLAASISHEVRNPLTVTKGFLQLLRNNEFSKEKQEQFFDLAIKELQHAEHIITDYLAFAKPSKDNNHVINVYDELNRSIEIIKSYANMQSVEIQTDMTDLTSWIAGERQKLHQCIMNITKNSIDAMPNGGVLYINLQSDDDYVTINIKDTGVGMTSDQIKRLGEPYFSTKEKGTGLGMMVVLNIVKSMNGKFNITSTLDEGTTVTLTFPKVEEQQMSKINKVLVS